MKSVEVELENPRKEEKKCEESRGKKKRRKVKEETCSILKEREETFLGYFAWQRHEEARTKKANKTMKEMTVSKPGKSVQKRCSLDSK